MNKCKRSSSRCIAATSPFSTMRASVSETFMQFICPSSGCIAVPACPTVAQGFKMSLGGGGDASVPRARWRRTLRPSKSSSLRRTVHLLNVQYHILPVTEPALCTTFRSPGDSFCPKMTLFARKCVIFGQKLSSTIQTTLTLDFERAVKAGPTAKVRLFSVVSVLNKHLLLPTSSKFTAGLKLCRR